jgi:hypothetical protein
VSQRISQLKLEDKFMDKKVKLDILVKLSKTNNFDINKTLNIRKYVPFEEKIKHIDKFVDEVIDQDGNYNSIDKYFKFTMMVFNIYTNLDLSNTYEEYDKLVSNSLLDVIFSEIEADYYDLRDFMDMRFNDKLREIYAKNK